MEAIAPLANPTEFGGKTLVQRAAYVAARRPYVDFVAGLLDTATLPPSRIALANVTTIAALTAALRRSRPDEPGLNGIVLGRVLHRLFPGLLTRHGEVHALAMSPGGVKIFGQTTTYRFPEVLRARQAFNSFTGRSNVWSRDFDEWQNLATTFRAAHSSAVRLLLCTPPKLDGASGRGGDPLRQNRSSYNGIILIRG